MRLVIVMAINGSSVFPMASTCHHIKVLWDVIGGSSVVVGDAAIDHRALIALANASCSFRWYELIAFAPANDRNQSGASRPTAVTGRPGLTAT
jgi:hypothetical protein